MKKNWETVLYNVLQEEAWANHDLEKKGLDKLSETEIHMYLKHDYAAQLICRIIDEISKLEEA